MGIKFGSIKRRVQISIENARANKLVSLVEGATDQELKQDKTLRRFSGTTYKSDVFTQGWEPRETSSGSWYLAKDISVPQVYSEEHQDAGPPKLPESMTIDEALNAFNDMIESMSETDIPKMFEAMNNGMYLNVSAKSKPKAKMTQEDILAIFAPLAKPEDWVEYGKAAAGRNGLDWLRNWYSKQG